MSMTWAQYSCELAYADVNLVCIPGTHLNEASSYSYCSSITLPSASMVLANSNIASMHAMVSQRYDSTRCVAVHFLQYGHANVI